MNTRLKTFIYCFIIVTVFAKSQERVYRDLTVRVDGGVEFVITDPFNKKSGFDPKINKRYDEINDSYGVFTVDSEDPNVEPPESVNEFMTSEPIDGNYKLSLHGTKLSKFTLFIVLARSIQPGDRKAFEFKGISDSGATLQYQIEYASTPGVPLIARRIIEKSTLHQDLDNCFKLGLIKNQGLYTSLKQKADNATTQHEKGQDRSAVNLLQAFLNEVKAQTDKGLDKDAATILTEDAQALIQQWKK